MFSFTDYLYIVSQVIVRTKGIEMSKIYITPKSHDRIVRRDICNNRYYRKYFGD